MSKPNGFNIKQKILLCFLSKNFYYHLKGINYKLTQSVWSLLPSTRVDTASRASSCTPPAFPEVLNMRNRALITWSEILGASSEVTFLRTLCNHTNGQLQ